MNIDSRQAADILGLSAKYVLTLCRNGDLKAVNERKAGAKKFFPRFDIADVRALKRTRAETHKPRHMNGRETLAIVSPISIIDRLNAIEEKIDQLCAVWGCAGTPRV